MIEVEEDVVVTANITDPPLSISDSLPLTLFYASGLEIVVLHVMVPQPYRFSPLLFNIGMVV
jgi:hypothetical protein